MKSSVNPKFFLHHIKFQGACIKIIMCLTQSLNLYLGSIILFNMFCENDPSDLTPEAQTILVVVFWLNDTIIENNRERG